MRKITVILMAALFCFPGLARAGVFPTDGYGPTLAGAVDAIVVQPDGKALVSGYFDYNGGLRIRLVRFDVNGYDDTTCNKFYDVEGSIYAIALQSNGSMIIGGNFYRRDNTSLSGIARVNSYLSFDHTFPRAAGSGEIVYSVAVMGNGKIVAGGNFTKLATATRGKIGRMNADSTIDTTFNTSMGANGTVYAVAAQPDNKIIAAGDFTTMNGITRTRIARLNDDGSVDTTFDPGTGADAKISAVALQPDGKVIIAGNFTTFNGTARNRIARLNTNGSLDTSFDPGTGLDAAINALTLQPDGKIVIGGIFTTFNGTSRNRIARLNMNGSLDTTFDPGTGANAEVKTVAVQPDGKVLLGGTFSYVNGVYRVYIARLNIDGSVENHFNNGTGVNNIPTALATQPDYKTIIGGAYTIYNGTPRTCYARVNPSGSLDTAFNPSVGAGRVDGIALQRDWRTVSRGYFQQGSEGKPVMGLNPDGTRDTGFTQNPGINVDVIGMAIARQDKIMVCGIFSRIDYIDRRFIARINGNGSLDPAFSAYTFPEDYRLNNVLVQPDGKVIYAGDSDGVYGMGTQRLVRLNTDGTTDTTFHAVNDPYYNDVWCLALQLDGKILVGGGRIAFNGVQYEGIMRLNADGSTDTSFNPGTGFNNTVWSMVVQADGKILVGGVFTTYNGNTFPHIARLKPNGTVDNYDFWPGSGANADVYGIALQADGKILVTGDFTSLLGAAETRYGRLTNTHAAAQSISVAADRHSVTWNMGGTFPVPYQVLFEDSADGVNWTALGYGVPVVGTGYTLTGLNLPNKTNRYIRASGWAACGWMNNSVSLYQSVRQYYMNVTQYTLTYLAGTGGTVNGSASVTQTVDRGTSASTVTAIPNPHYHFVQWSDGVQTASRTDTNVQADATRTANFLIDTYGLNYSAGIHGYINGADTQTIGYGGSGSPVTAVPDNGYVFLCWSDGSVANPRTDTNVTASVNVSAVFTVNSSTIWVNFANNSGNEDGSQTYPFNTMWEGALAVPSSGTVRIFSGSTATPSRITRPMRIESWNGTATIGAQR